MMTGFHHRFAICGCVLLAACSQGATEDPAVVLERASVAAQQLDSASFDIEYSYDGGTSGMRVDGTAEGRVAERGRTMDFSFQADITVPAEGVDRTVSAAGNVVVAGENEAYLRFSRLDGSLPFLPGIGLLSDQSLDTWYRAGSGETPSADISPDPSFIALQTSALRVTDDRSFETVDGHECFAYEVELDTEKMVRLFESTAERRGQAFDRVAAETFMESFRATGTVWIDASTSVIRRISWSFSAVPGLSDATGRFSLHLDRHGEPVEITIPAAHVPLSDVLTNVTFPTL
jgi:hypothetical protein